LYIKLESIAKEQKSQRNLNKWNNYNIKLTQEVYEKLKGFIPIQNTKNNTKAFRLKNKGEDTGIFKTIPNQIGYINEEPANSDNNSGEQGQRNEDNGNQEQRNDGHIQINQNENNIQDNPNGDGGENIEDDEEMN
jgi:hypothetical protein